MVTKNREGQILVRTIIEMFGIPKGHVETTLRSFVEKLKEEFDVVKEDFAPCEERNKMFSTFTELELWFPTVLRLFDFCFEAMPSSIEILEPSNIEMQASDLAGYINDLQGRLHTLDMDLKTSHAKHEVLTNNAENLFRNLVTLALKERERTLAELSEDMGIKESELQFLLDKMLNAGLLQIDKGSYKRVSKDSTRH